jgi:hypothetical protein
MFYPLGRPDRGRVMGHPSDFVIYIHFYYVIIEIETVDLALTQK